MNSNVLKSEHDWGLYIANDRASSGVVLQFASVSLYVIIYQSVFRPLFSRELRLVEVCLVFYCKLITIGAV